MSAAGKITASAINEAKTRGEQVRIQVRIKGVPDGQARESLTKVKDAETMNVYSVRINWPIGRQRRRTYTLAGVLEDGTRIEVPQVQGAQTFWLTDRNTPASH